MSEFKKIGPGGIAPGLKEALLELRESVVSTKTELERLRDHLVREKIERVEISESERTDTE